MITSTSNARIKQLALWNQKAKERRKDGVFIAEGIKMFEEAPIGWIKEIYISESFYNKMNDWQKEKLTRCSYETVSDAIFQKISDTQSPQGVLCVLTQPKYTFMDLGMSRQSQPLVMVLEDIQDPGNLGTIIRTGEGAGVTGIIMTRETVDIFNPKTIRATMGSVYRVPFLYVDSIEDAIKSLKRNNIQVYAAHLKGDRKYNELNFTRGTAFLIGNEGNGLREETAQLADTYLKIPMEGRVESLNAAVASSILMYEAHRQRESLS